MKNKYIVDIVMVVRRRNLGLNQILSICISILLNSKTIKNFDSLDVIMFNDKICMGSSNMGPSNRRSHRGIPSQRL